MGGRKKILILAVTVLVTVTIPTLAQARPRRLFPQGGHGGHGGHFGTAHRGFGGGWGGFFGFGVGGFYYPYAPVLFIGPGGFMPPYPAMMPPPMAQPGPLLPPPPMGMMPLQPALQPRPVTVKGSDQARAAQLITLGDRMFRAGNLKKAEDRYEQAVRAAPDLAAPRVRQAQIALARANYTEAANRLRDAETAEPGWIITAPDIQSLYGEPSEFSRTIGRIETHLQLNPDDRDAWLILGAEWFLSGRTAKAANVFKRLNDPARKPDNALAAFLDASNQAEIKAAKPDEPAKDGFAK
jgi:hypothetical protein